MKRLIRLLDELVPHPEIPLSFHDPYTLLIAVLLSAQCTDERVNKVTLQLFKKASTPQAMVALGIPAIERIIRSCGLYRTKAKHIWLLSEKLLVEYGGKVPQTFEELEKLPGVGHKTASVVLVQGFGIPAFPVDRHIARSARRWGLSSQKTVLGVEKDLQALFPKKLWGRLHLQMILAARKFCRARPHEPSGCPICSRLGSIK